MQYMYNYLNLLCKKNIVNGTFLIFLLKKFFYFVYISYYDINIFI